jgi:2-polyprenyl-3-methyl-5-hydroxy-6-metoxy-1,4-benzoquinol methylase
LRERRAAAIPSEEKGGVEREYSGAYADIYRRHWWWRAREEVVIETLRRLRPAHGSERILDIGCGDGLMFDRLAEFGQVEGVEPETAVLSDRNRERIFPVAFDENFQPGKRYTIVLMLDVLEHLREADAALRRAVALLDPGGILLITAPAFPVLWTRHDELNHHVRRYTRRTLRELTQNQPLEIVEERYLFQALFPAKLVVRAVEGLLGLPPRVPSVPPTWLNSAMQTYTRIEERSFRHARAPFGASLLLAAREKS